MRQERRPKVFISSQGRAMAKEKKGREKRKKVLGRFGKRPKDDLQDGRP
jgi:hypothetical protein